MDHKTPLKKKTKPKLKLKFKKESGKTNGSASVVIKPERVVQEGVIFICESCGRKYKSSKSLTNHKRVACGKKYAVSLSKCLYSDCTREFYHKSKMLEHLKEDHNQDMEEHVLNFRTKEEFLHWKEKEERGNYVYFSKRRKESKSGDSRLAYYVCQHDGQIYSHRKSTEPARKTNRKYKRGSVRTNIVCLARMRVKYSDDKVEVRYISTHSHEISLKNTEFQPMPSDVKQFIAEQLSKGVAPREVKGKLQEKLAERDQRDTQHHMKVQHLNLQTIYQMKKRMFQAKPSTVLDSDDAASIGRQVEKLQHEFYDPVIIYKPQNSGMVVGNCDPSEIEDFDNFFVLGIQTKEQKEILLENGQIICIDASLDTEVPDFKLYTFLISDGFGSSYPTAQFITNRTCTPALSAMFKTLQQRCPAIGCGAVITDDDPNIFDAMSIAFGVSNLRCNLYSQWHVCHMWHKLLNQHVADKVLRNEINSKLIAIMREPNQDSCHELARNFCLSYEKKAPQIVEIFNAKYLPIVTLWATSYRFPCPEMDADGFVETYHSRIKSYQTSSIGKRIDELIDVLLKMEVELYRERKKKLAPLTNDSNSLIPNRHKASLKIPDEDISKGSLINVWYVKSHKTKGTHFVVTKECDQCTLDFCYDKCREPSCENLCCHLYICTCPDRAALCKHIHKVHSLRVKQHLHSHPVTAEQIESFIHVALQDSSSSSVMLAETVSPQMHFSPPAAHSETEMQCQQVAAECAKICKLTEDPAIRKYMLGSIVTSLQQIVKQCEAIATKSTNDPLPQPTPPIMPANTATIYQPHPSSVWAWPQCQY